MGDSIAGAGGAVRASNAGVEEAMRGPLARLEGAAKSVPLVGLALFEMFFGSVRRSGDAGALRPTMAWKRWGRHQR